MSRHTFPLPDHPTLQEQLCLPGPAAVSALLKNYAETDRCCQRVQCARARARVCVCVCVCNDHGAWVAHKHRSVVRTVPISSSLSSSLLSLPVSLLPVPPVATSYPLFSLCRYIAVRCYVSCCPTSTYCSVYTCTRVVHMMCCGTCVCMCCGTCVCMCCGTCKVLDLEYVDLLLIHWPCDKFEDTLATYVEESI